MIGYNARPKKEHISTAPFNTAFYEYTLTPANGLTTMTASGSLALLSGLDSTNCPAGRILREVGRKLYPGADPGLQPGETNYVSGYNHIWTKVYDVVTGFSGYIDTNSAIFAPYANTPVEFVDVGEQDGSDSRLGASVYTAGNVTAVGSGIFGGNVSTVGSGVFNGNLNAVGSGTFGSNLIMQSGVFNQFRPITLLTTNANATLTTSQLLGGYITQVANNANYTATLPSTASIITALGSRVGASSDFIFWNSGASNVTLTAGDGNTSVVGTMALANVISRFTVIITGSSTVALLRA